MSPNAAGGKAGPAQAKGRCKPGTLQAQITRTQRGRASIRERLPHGSLDPKATHQLQASRSLHAPVLRALTRHAWLPRHARSRAGLADHRTARSCARPAGASVRGGAAHPWAMVSHEPSTVSASPTRALEAAPVPFEIEFRRGDIGHVKSETVVIIRPTGTEGLGDVARALCRG